MLIRLQETIIAPQLKGPLIKDMCRKSWLRNFVIKLEYSDPGYISASNITFPNYNYDDSVGAQVAVDGTDRTVGFTPSELGELPENKAPNLFYDLEQKFRKKFADLSQ